MQELMDPRILELMASRICHDLVSPVGAIGNGVELIQELGAADDAMELIADSANQASVRLKLFRLCYGAAGTDKNIGFKDVRDVFMDLMGKDSRVAIDMDQDIGLKFSMPPKGFFKTLLSLFLMAEECNRGGGTFKARVSEDGTGVDIIIENPTAAFRDGAENALSGNVEIDDLDPRSVHAYLTGKFAKYFGLDLSWESGEGRILFSLKIK